MGLLRVISDRLPGEPFVTSSGEVVTTRRQLHESWARQWLEFSDGHKRGLLARAQRDPDAARLLEVIEHVLGDNRWRESLPRSISSESAGDGPLPPGGQVLRHLRESIEARESAGVMMGAGGGDSAPGSPEYREVELALEAARAEHDAALRVADQHRDALEPDLLELVDAYRYNPPPFVVYPAKPWRATVVGSLKRVWTTLDDEQRSRSHRERHVDTTSPFYRGGREPGDCPLCEAG